MAQKLGRPVGVILMTSPWLDRMSRKKKATAQSKRLMIMMGMEYSSMRRRPTRSIRTRDRRVIPKFVTAIDSEARVGDEKPTSANMVAEKYMREF